MINLAERKTKLLIALDYDETFTADPQLWKFFIINAQRRGHKVIIVSWRTPEMGKEVLAEMDDLVDCYFTSHQAKRYHMERLGIYPDIWIDDNPASVESGAPDVPPWDTGGHP